MSVSLSITEMLLEDIQGESSALAANNAPYYSAWSVNNASISTESGMANYLVTLPETGIAEEVFRAYEGVLGRAPTSSELHFYVSYAETGLTPSQVALGPTAVSQSTWDTIFSGFYHSAEYAARFGGTISGPDALTNPEFATLMYAQVLNRVPTTAEINFYVNQMNNGTSRVTVLEEFVNSSEYINDTKSQIDASLVAGALNDTGSGPTYSEIAFGHSSGDSTLSAAHHAASAAHLGLLHQA